MCGIAATIGYTKDDMKILLDQIIHRGKDSRGVMEFEYKSNNIILGHNRLSINDTSDHGIQPMQYEDVYLIVNGEIWNYPELRTEYIERGYTFQSTSDSEIILYLYKENELNRLDGMFSFIIYENGKLTISRDWVGKLPLYMYQNGSKNIILASELKSILALQPHAIPKFIPKNSLIEIDLDTDKWQVHEDFYFNFSNKETKSINHEDVGLKTYELLKNSVHKRLLSDVPIATSLSGGIDSAVITYLLSTEIPNLKAYTAKFDENSRDLMFARIVAKHLNVELIEVEIPRDPEILKKRFLDMIDVIEYPSTVQTQVGIMQSFIAEQMAKDGIKVAFSGEGSDESYGSYGMIRMFSKKPDWSAVRKKLFEKQHYGNLLRGNTVFMNYGTIELRCPFFDTDFLDYTANLTDEFLTHKSQWKLPLADAFRPYLPESVIEQEKRAFQKGTNFKTYIEDVIMSDPLINFNNRKNMFHVIADNFKKKNGFSHKKLREPMTVQNKTENKWF